MRQRVTLSSRKGLLLVEAVLSAVVIAVGLVVISRGLGSQLKALHTMEEYETLLTLAREKLLELETERLIGPAPAHERHEGAFHAPYDFYQWKITASLRNDLKEENGDSMASDITLTVQREDHTSSMIRLRAIWPSVWVPPEWF